MAKGVDCRFLVFPICLNGLLIRYLNNHSMTTDEQSVKSLRAQAAGTRKPANYSVWRELAFVSCLANAPVMTIRVQKSNEGRQGNVYGSAEEDLGHESDARLALRMAATPPQAMRCGRGRLLLQRRRLQTFSA
jgi:hypothetical protein